MGITFLDSYLRVYFGDVCREYKLRSPVMGDWMGSFILYEVVLTLRNRVRPVWGQFRPVDIDNDGG